jgi:hypothetical protein
VNARPSLPLRQFFGFLLPGLVWLAAAAAFVIPHAPLAEIASHVARATIVASAVVSAIAFLLGVATQGVSYAAAKLVADVLDRISKRQDGYEQELFQAAANRLADVAKKEGFLADGERKKLPEYRQWREVFLRAKWFVLIRAPVLGRRLLEVETEINIVGMVLLPTVVLGAVLLYRTHQGVVPVDGVFEPGQWTGGLFAALIVALLSLGSAFREARRQEARIVLQTFLLSADLAKAKPNASKVAQRKAEVQP